jgi:microcystin-dependent protein
MAHASSSLTTRRSWLQRLRGWWQPAAPAAPAFAPRRSPYHTAGSSPYLGEIALFCGNFAPANWAFCDGGLVPISQYEDLFTLIGTTYGGDGEVTFALPDLRGRAPMHSGNSTGPGLSPRFLGEQDGTETVTLTLQQMPNHNHPLGVSSAPGTTASPQGAVPADGGNGSAQYTPDTANLLTQPAQFLGAVGGYQPHENMQPYLVVNYIISLFGVYPQP